MRQFRKFLAFFTFFLALFVFVVLPWPAHAAPVGDIFSSPDSLIVKIQERIEYFLAFKTEQKVVVLEKQAERRLARAENMVKTKDVDQALSMIKSYEAVKEKQGDLIGDASAIDLTEAKTQTVEQQARIEDMKEDMPGDEKEIIDDIQKTVINTMIENVKAKEGEGSANEFAERVENVLDPGSNIFEIAPGSAGALDVAP